MPDAWFKTPKTDIAELDRDAPEQRRVDAETTSIALYHYETCMFCARVRSVIERLELHIELRNIHTDREHLRDLVNSGGRHDRALSSNRWGRGDVDVRVGRHYPLSGGALRCAQPVLTDPHAAQPAARRCRPNA